MTAKIFNKHFFWIALGIPLLTFLVLKPTFGLSLYGDDWASLYYTYLEFEVRHSYNWFDIKTYLGPYNFSYFFLGLLHKLFGLNSMPYFLVSYFFRVLATISIYFLVKYLTKNTLAPFLSSLIFILSTTGLETTDWVFNMNTYLGIFFYNFSLISFFKIHSSPKIEWLNYLAFIILFTVSLILVSTRMHGSVPFMIVSQLILVFFIKKSKFNLNILFKLLVPVAILILLMKIGGFGAVESGGFTDRLNLGFKTAKDLFDSGQKIFLLFFPGIIGHVVIPDAVSQASIELFGFRFSVIFYTAIILILATLVILRKNISKSVLSISFLSLAGITIAWILFSKSLSDPNFSKGQLLSIILGGEFLVLLPWLFFHLRKNHPDTAFTIIFSWLWIIAFTLLYWLFAPSVLLETTGRYLTMAAVGFAFFLGSFIAFLIKNVKKQLVGLPMLILGLWLVLNFFAINRYLTILETNRNSKLANSIWESLIATVKDLDTENPTIFYFTADNPYSLHWNLVFGFPMHMGLTYKIRELTNTPIPETDYPTLLGFVKDGSPLKTHGRPIKPVPLDRIYAYHLSGDKVYSQTDQIRKKIEKDLQESP